MFDYLRLCIRTDFLMDGWMDGWIDFKITINGQGSRTNTLKVDPSSTLFHVVTESTYSLF